ncbi:MAG: ROK family protein, partial [Syntrophomonadaceae bacterium]|nr:ROK family protein [Syntrophomonadaceae bacterium]
DLGATKTLVGAGRTSGDLLARIQFPTPIQCHPEVAVDEMVLRVRKIMADNNIADDQVIGVAVGAPGPVAYPEGIIYDSPNLAWQEFALRQELEKRLGWPTVVEHDVAMAALGEYHFGQMKRYPNLLYVTLSTGVGAGIIINGELYRGSIGGAGEIGHMVIDPRGRQCNCGRRGCTETIISGTALAIQARELVEQGRGACLQSLVNDGVITAKEVAIAARQGDSDACRLVANFREALQLTLANLVHIFNPDIIVLGGGVVQGMKDLIFEGIEEEVKARVFSMHRPGVKIEITRLGGDIVLYGCLAAGGIWGFE